MTTGEEADLQLELLTLPPQDLELLRRKTLQWLSSPLSATLLRWQETSKSYLNIPLRPSEQWNSCRGFLVCYGSVRRKCSLLALAELTDVCAGVCHEIRKDRYEVGGRLSEVGERKLSLRNAQKPDDARKAGFLAHLSGYG